MAKIININEERAKREFQKNLDAIMKKVDQNLPEILERIYRDRPEELHEPYKWDNQRGSERGKNIESHLRLVKKED